MSYTTPAGTKFYVTSTFAAAKTATNVTNGNPAVVTSTSHGYVDGDIVRVNSGWEEITDMLVKVDQSDANTFSLVGVNTVNSDLHVCDLGEHFGAGALVLLGERGDLQGEFSLGSHDMVEPFLDGCRNLRRLGNVVVVVDLH